MAQTQKKNRGGKRKKPKRPAYEPPKEGHGPLIGDRSSHSSLGDGPERSESSMGDRERGGNW